MKRQDFIEFFYEAKTQQIVESISKSAIHLHDVEVNQKYDGDLPYSYHLKLVANYAFLYANLVCEYTHHIIPIMFAAYFHDSIEDARCTYNDVLKLAKNYMTDYQAKIAVDIVYALTDEKGKNRAERANDKYFEGIRNTMYAPFVKWCDRMANMSYSKNTNSRMLDVYKKEANEFLEGIGGSKYITKGMCNMIINF